MTLERIEEAAILDNKAALEGLGDAGVFDELMESFEELVLKHSLAGLKIALDERDWPALRTECLSLVGTASIAYAERLKLAASSLQRDAERKDIEAVAVHYPLVIKQAILLKQKIRQALSADPGSSPLTLHRTRLHSSRH